MAEIAQQQARPLLIYDGNCGFCMRSVRRIQFLTGEGVAYAASQEVGEKFPQITTQEFTESVWLILPDKKIVSGAEAIFRALASVWYFRWIFFLYQVLPGFAFMSERIYRWIARHRSTCHIPS